MKLETRHYPFIVFSTALAVRLILFAAVGTDVPTSGDPPSYLAIAESLRLGKGFSLDGVNPTATRMPVYPLFLAGILSFPGADVGTVMLVQLVIDAFTCVLVFFLARELLGLGAALMAGLSASFYLPLALRCMTVMTETLFTFFLVSSVLFLVYRPRDLRMNFLGALSIGVATLVRPNGLVVAFFLLLWIFSRRDVWRKKLLRAAVYLACFAAVILPWVVRNAVVFHEFIPTYTLGGAVLYNSYILPDRGFGYTQVMEEHARYFSLEGEAEKDDYLADVALEYVKNKPFRALKLIPAKLGVLVYPYDMKWLWPGFPFRFNVFWGVISLLSVFAVFSDFSGVRERLSLLLFSFGALLATSIVLYGSPRLRSPYDPLFIVTASMGAESLLRRRRKRLWTAGLVLVLGILLAAGESPRVATFIEGLKQW